jgi:hypothetical protein
MNTGKYIFSQILDFLPMYDFKMCIDRYKGNFNVRTFTCFDQFICMAFAQLTYRDSLRDIEVCLRSMEKKLYHIGIRGKVSRSTLAEANENRDWRIYSDFAHILINHARKLYANDSFGIDIEETVYALDVYWFSVNWNFPCFELVLNDNPNRRRKCVRIERVILHTLLDLRGNIPTFISITDGKVHDVNILDELIPEVGAFYVMDRGYLDFHRLFIMNQNLAFFIIRFKKNTKYKRLYSSHVDKSTGLICDQVVVLTGNKSKVDYPEKLRRIHYFDSVTNKHFNFATNNFNLPALTITQLYKSRWQVELFFKWIKQHLKIKTFYGTTENAVKTQIWIAVSTYVLVAIIKKELNLGHSLYTILQILSLSLFEKHPLYQLLEDDGCSPKYSSQPNQLNLFDY